MGKKNLLVCVELSQSTSLSGRQMEQKGTAVPHQDWVILLQGAFALPGNHNYLKNRARTRRRVNCELLCANLVI